MMRAVILGCGSSGGVPRLGGHWGACDPADPRNRRRRCALLVERTGPDGVTRLLIDTGPDLVPQLTDAAIGTLDAVAWTHPHADHIHGIDDLRQITQNTGRLLRGWADEATAAVLTNRFGYVFATPPGSAYPPIVALERISGPFRVDGVGGTLDLVPFQVDHGGVPSLGFRITARDPAGNPGGDRTLVYLPDVKSIPETAWPAIMGADLFICDALRRTPHPSHAHLDLTLGWIARSGARGVITNMHIDLDYATLAAELPAGVIPAHDGLELVP